MAGQCRGQDNVASLRVLVIKQDLLFVVAAGFAVCDILLSCSLSYCAIVLYRVLGYCIIPGV